MGTRQVTNNNGHVYVVCSHIGCSKKAWNFDGHDCCGKPWHHRDVVEDDSPSLGSLLVTAVSSWFRS